MSTATSPASTSFDPGRSGRLFTDVRASGRGALVGFLHVGYPDVATSLKAVQALCGVDGDERRPGVDLVEVGMPYSDPMMDGVTIQRAGTKALARGVRTRDAFAAVEAVAQTGTQAVVMTYWNLIEKYGPDAFARDLAAAGGSGAITPDLTPDEADAWMAASDAHQLDRIFLVSPSSTDERIARTVAACRGWVYATAVMGVTGARSQTSSAAPALVERIRRADPSALVGVGSRRLQRRPGPRGDRVRRCGHRRLGSGGHAAGRRGRRNARRPERVADGGRRPRVRGPYR